MKSAILRLGLCYSLYKKEMRAYFDNPTAYVVTVVLLVLCGYFFATPLFLRNQAMIGGFTGIAPMLFLFFIPAITMRLYSEEMKSGTIELLSTLPVRDEEVLGAKFLAAMTVVTFMLLGTFSFPLTLGALGAPDWGAIAGAYAGLWLTAAVYAAIGLWASSMTRNQIIAFIIAFLVNFLIFLSGKVHDFVPENLAFITDFIGVDSHLDRISRGLLDCRDILYFLSFSGYFLYLTHLNTHVRRLRG
jgi:ABC-2 type transport system permease protein